MDESYSFSARSARDRQRSRGWIAAIAFVAFLMVAALAFFLVRGGDGSLRMSSGLGEIFQLREEEAARDQVVQEAGTAEPALPVTDEREGPREEAEEARRAERVEQVAEQQGGLDQRVAALEQRIARLNLRAAAAAGNAARAEGLLISFAARRAIERGAPLGYLGDQLRLRFGDALPNAVQTVLAAGENPITLDQLLARLDGLAPVLSQTPADEGMLSWLGSELSQLFVVRREETPSPRAESRLQRARLFLESGRTEAAISEVRNLPNAGEAAEWIADAERYAAAQRALELLETTAILEPRELRDGAGNPVEQPSPVL